jgi:hypothetical protein
MGQVLRVRTSQPIATIFKQYYYQRPIYVKWLPLSEERETGPIMFSMNGPFLKHCHAQSDGSQITLLCVCAEPQTVSRMRNEFEARTCH